jgi:acyl carrier protein
MLNTVIAIMEELLERDPGSVKAEDEFREYDEWDSLAYLSVIAKIDEDYGMVIPREEFRELRNIKALADYLESHIK